MHLCKVRVISKSKLFWLNQEKSFQIKIIRSHLSQNTLISHTLTIFRLNLSHQTKDNIIVSCKADHHTANSIKLKLLVSFNGAEEDELKEALKN